MESRERRARSTGSSGRVMRWVEASAKARSVSPRTAGCSKISFSMKWRWLPLPIRAPERAVCTIGRWAGLPSMSTMRAPSRVRKAMSPSSRYWMRLVMRGQRHGVRAHEHLALAIADGERAALAGDDDEILPALEQHRERERPLEPAQGREGRGLGVEPARHLRAHQMRHHLGVGLRWRTRGPWPGARPGAGGSSR